MNDTLHSQARPSRATVLFAAAAVLAILIATLTPSGGIVPPFTGCIICGTQGMADVLCNIALFVPFGAALIAVGARPSRAVLVGVLLSAVVEGMQATVIPGRDPSLGDIVFNSLGTIAGCCIACTAHIWANPGARARRLLALAGICAAGATVAATGVILQPSFERTDWYGQWTANFGNMEIYRGRVLDAQLGGRALPSRRLDDNGAARQALLDGKPLTVRVQSSPLTRRISAIFSVYDGRRSEQFLLGANGADLDLYVRRRADDFRLINPPLRFESALAGVAGGDTLTLEVRRAGNRWCAGRIPDAPCLGYTAGLGWDFLQDFRFLRRRASLMNALWLFGLLVPAGFWLRGRAGLLAGVASVGLVCAAVPMMSGLLVSPPLEWAGAVCGLLGGNLLWRSVRSRTAELR
ncbi:MAG: VanZ family protein [Gemmatimonadaceae bacterium]